MKRRQQETEAAMAAVMAALVAAGCSQAAIDALLAGRPEGVARVRAPPPRKDRSARTNEDG